MAALYVVFGIAMLAFGIAQMVVGFLGLEWWLSAGWAWGILIACFFFRFTLPITIASFFGATEVLGWHWFWALLFAVPGLAMMIPGVLAVILDLFRQRRVG